MKTVLGIFSFVIATTFFSSCHVAECGACDTIFPQVRFKIMNGSDQNIAFGPNKVYTSDRIKIRVLDAGILSDAPKLFSGDTTSAQTSFIFYGQLFEQYYLYIDEVKTDSFQISYQHNPPAKDCCPGFNSISLLKVNNVPTSYVYPGTADPLKIVK